MKPVLRNYGPPLVSGILLAMSFPRWNAHPMAWFALVPLFRQGFRLAPRQALYRFMLAGLVFHALLLQWLLTNVYWAGGWAVVGYSALCMLMAAYWAVAGCLWTFIRSRLPVVPGLIALAALWPVMEFLQSRLFTGFGWSAIGYGQARNPYVLQLAAVGGVFLISSVVVSINALVAKAMDRGRIAVRIAWLAAAFAILLAAHGAGAVLLGTPDYSSRPLTVGIVQPDFPLEMKWDPEYTVEMVRNTAEKSLALARHGKIDLFVWPEALIMEEIDQPPIWSLVSGLVRATGAWLYTGSERRNEVTGGYPNSSHLVSPDGKIAGYYDKVHLAPFGEYVPFGKYFPFIKSVVPAIGDVEFGDGLKTFDVAGRRMGPLICFEVLFSNLFEELRARNADLIVVITNLGWFGSSNAIPQELEIARVRAVESRLPLVHSANTGISGVFDPWGRFTMANGRFTNNEFVLFRAGLSPEMLVMQRVGAVLPVAAPAPRPAPHLPWLFPWLMAALVVMAVCAALIWPRYRPVQ